MTTEAAARLAQGLAELGERDADLARVVELYGPPPTRVRPQGFATLFKIIVGQQVSIASADAIWARVEAALSPPTAEAVQALSEEELRGLGLSRPKARYARALAAAVAERRIDLDGLGALPDEEAIAALIALPGIGRWTAEIYLLSALQRPDVWPAADLALLTSAQQVKALPARPTAVEMLAIAEAWRPWRAIAARVLWHNYRHARRRDPGM